MDYEDRERWWMESLFEREDQVTHFNVLKTRTTTYSDIILYRDPVSFKYNREIEKCYTLATVVWLNEKRP